MDLGAEPAGQLIVNVGDMLQEATAGYLPSTTHRVAVSDLSQPTPSRMALPMFLHPRPEVVLSRVTPPVSTFLSALTSCASNEWPGAQLAFIAAARQTLCAGLLWACLSQGA
ncbi:MAG: hypothetical protein CM15mP74_18490 [Halieaceae bacterium]|nr:MAG: hypothetical protein CM15mP74_18490 [Halieaceae bacterium]